MEMRPRRADTAQPYRAGSPHVIIRRGANAATRFRAKRRGGRGRPRAHEAPDDSLRARRIASDSWPEMRAVCTLLDGGSTMNAVDQAELDRPARQPAPPPPPAEREEE